MKLRRAISFAMKILFFAPHQFWPITTGTRVRDFYLARALSQRSEVTFLELLHPKDTPRAAPRDAGVAQVVTASRGRTYSAVRLLRGLIGPMPVTVWNCYSKQASGLLETLLNQRRFDAVHIVGSPLAAYLPAIRSAPSRPAVIIDWHNIESVLMRRYAERAETLAHRLVARRSAQLLERLELKLLQDCDAHIAVSEADRQRLKRACPSARVHCIPNGVDASWYAEVSPGGDRAAELARRTDVLFVGSMDYFPNVDGACWFHQEVWPLVRQASPRTRLVIVGRDPHPRVQQLRSEQVHVTGTVEDVRPYYAAAVAAVVPLRSGAGSRLKIPEAMAAGVPVISTRIGAEGLDLTPGDHYLAAETPEEFADAFRWLLNSPEHWQRLSETGMRLARERFDWGILGQRAYDIHMEAQRVRSKER